MAYTPDLSQHAPFTLQRITWVMNAPDRKNRLRITAFYIFS